MIKILVPRCARCRSVMVQGIALINTRSYGIEDFPGVPDHIGQTFSYTGPARLVQVWKCSQCGHSFVLGNSNAK